jgi:hypothetical protein
MAVACTLVLISSRKKYVMDQQTYIIRFDEISEADANRYAIELRNMILDASPDVEVERRRDNPSTLDFGATLVLILGTPAATAVTSAIAQAIGNWLLRHKGDITIERENGKITKISGTNLPTNQQLKLINEILSKE